MPEFSQFVLGNEVRRSERNLRGIPQDTRLQFRHDILFQGLLVHLREPILVCNSRFRRLVRNVVVYFAQRRQLIRQFVQQVELLEQKGPVIFHIAVCMNVSRHQL